MARTVYEFSYKARRAFWRKIYTITALVLVLFVIVTLLFKFLLFPVVIKSESMIPSLERNSVVLMSPAISVERGDAVLVDAHISTDLNFLQRGINKLVAFFTFQQVLPFENKEKFSEAQTMRRVVGMPGDTIYMENYVLYIKPAGSPHFLTEFELSATDYDINISGVPSFWDDTLGTAGSFSEIVVKENQYFLLCDNRTSGVDSRVWGVVDKQDIKATAFLQYFPFTRIRIL
ncbi:MAG: signal peptidase I [Spirochaetaceae bacterium]|nr:signal peptidase I [Spirochaetaceae bacterium]